MRYRILIAVPGLALALAACGGEQGVTQASPGRDTAPASSLAVSVKASEQAAATTWTLECDPAGGDHPQAQQACTALAKLKDPFAPVSQNQQCTMIFAGPETATVTGTWRGQKVNAQFSRRNGCEDKRWSEVAPLFGDAAKTR